MPSLPLSTAFTDSAVTEGGFKTAITNQREFLSGLLGTDGVNATALATLGALFGSLTVKSTNYTVVSGDRGKIIQCTDTLTVSLTAAATLGAGFSFVVSNTGAGTVTIDPSGSELIGGELTQTLEENQTVVIYCTGTAFQIAGGGGSNYAMTTFTAPGTWTKPTGLKAVKVTVVGGGGAGGSAPATPSAVSAIASGGGGGGGTAILYISAPTIPGPVPVTRGAAGGTSSFGAFASATGGTAGATAGANTFGGGGGGGTGSSGDLNIGGGGGGGGYVGGNTPALGGTGGSSTLGGGGEAVVRTSPGTQNGIAGKLYGGGGSGAVKLNTGPGSTGGAGAAGVVIVEEFY